MKFSFGCVFQILFGFLVWHCVCQECCNKSFNLLCGWAGPAPSWVTEFGNTVRVFAGVCFVYV